MSTRAPIGGDDSVLDTFKNFKDNEELGFLQIGIDLDTNKFQIIKAEKSQGSHEKNWEKIKDILQEKEHSYFIVRDPLKEKLFILIHYGPDLSPVKQRMVYASSRASLKSFLGSSAFSEDYYLNSKKDCSVQALIDQRTLHTRIDFRSDSEIEKQQTSHETSAKATHSQVMKNLPIELEDSGKSAIEKYKNNQIKLAILSLKIDKQSIVGEEHKDDDIDNIKALLNETDPKYLLFWYSDSTDGNNDLQRVFVYYCPEKADRKEKFTYSTCKANVIDYCVSIGIEFKAKVEISDSKDFNTNYLDYHVFPKKEEKELFETPKAPGRKPKGKKSVNVKIDEES